MKIIKRKDFALVQQNAFFVLDKFLLLKRHELNNNFTDDRNSFFQSQLVPNVRAVNEAIDHLSMKYVSL